MEKEKATTSKAKLCTDKPAKSVSESMSAKVSTEAKIAELDQKWSDHFNRQEALLMARTLDREPTFSTVKVTPTRTPAASAVRSTNLFLKQADQPASATSSEFHDTDSSAAKHQSSSKTQNN